MQAPNVAGQAETGLRVTMVGRLALLSPMILACLALYTFGIALPKLATVFAGTPNVMLLTQLVGAMVGLAFAVGSPIAGRLADRHGYRVVYLWGAIVYAIAGVAGGLVDNLYLIILTRVVLGWSVAAVLVAAFKAVGMLPEKERAAMYGYQSVVGSFLSMVAFPIVGWLAAADWRYPFFLYGIAILIVPLILGLPAGTPTLVAVDSAAPRGKRFAGLTAPILLTALFLGVAIVVAPLFTPFYFADLGITDPGKQALPMMMLGGVAMLCCGWFGWLYRKLTAAGVFALGFTGLAAGLLLASAAGGLATLCLAMALASFGSSVLPSNLNAVAAERGGAESGRAIGIATGIFYGAQALFPFLGVAINARLGPASVFGVFGFATAAAAVAYALVWTGSRGRRGGLVAVETLPPPVPE